MKQIDEPKIAQKLQTAHETASGSINQKFRTMAKLCELLDLSLYGVATVPPYLTNLRHEHCVKSACRLMKCSRLNQLPETSRW